MNGLDELLARFTLTEPVEMADLATIHARIKAIMPTWSVDVVRRGRWVELELRLGAERVVRALPIAP